MRSVGLSMEGRGGGQKGWLSERSTLSFSLTKESRVLREFYHTDRVPHKMQGRWLCGSGFADGGGRVKGHEGKGEFEIRMEGEAQVPVMAATLAVRAGHALAVLVRFSRGKRRKEGESSWCIIDPSVCGLGKKRSRLGSKSRERGWEEEGGGKKDRNIFSQESCQ